MVVQYLCRSSAKNTAFGIDEIQGVDGMMRHQVINEGAQLKKRVRARKLTLVKTPRLGPY